jgi:hypothetical protein
MITGTPDTSSVKRLYIKDMVGSVRCGGCGRSVVKDFGEEYLSHVVDGEVITVFYWCGRCDHETERNYRFRVRATLEDMDSQSKESE